MAVALEVRHQAAQSASEIANRPDEACGTYQVEAPMRVRAHWQLEGLRGEASVLGFEETRVLVVDRDGNASLSRTVAFEAETGRAGTREHEWRVVGDEVFYRADNLPFERRAIDVAERAELLGETSDVFDTLVRATREQWDTPERTAQGWTLRARSDGRFGRRIRCAGEAGVDPWLRDLERRMSVVEADAIITLPSSPLAPSTRRGTWRLSARTDEGATPYLEITVDEQAERQAVVDPIVAPDEVFDVTRNRLHHEIGSFLRAVDEASP